MTLISAQARWLAGLLTVPCGMEYERPDGSVFTCARENALTPHIHVSGQEIVIPLPFGGWLLGCPKRTENES